MRARRVLVFPDSKSIEDAQQLVGVIFKGHVLPIFVAAFDDDNSTGPQRFADAIDAPLFNGVDDSDEIPLGLAEGKLFVRHDDGVDLEAGRFRLALGGGNAGSGNVETGDVPALARQENRIAALAHGDVERLAGAAALDRFDKQVDPDGVLTPQERAKRAESARKEYYTRLAFLSAQARRRKGGAA